MYRFKRILKRLFSPITIMVVPHDSSKRYSLKLPSVGIVLCTAIWIAFCAYVLASAVKTSNYIAMKEKLDFYRSQFTELQGSIAFIKGAEREFTRLLTIGGQKVILENLEADSGKLDTDAIKQEIEKSIEQIKDIKEFLQEQKNIYLATPKGWPVRGRITSEFGKRQNPINGLMDDHTGIDISAPKGTEIRATADGMVVFSGWSPGNGNLVVIEHGMGYRTLFAHNSQNLVSEGQKVKRGDKIALVGSTGNATGPHLHYEIWLNGKPQNPSKYLLEVEHVSQKK